MVVLKLVLSLPLVLASLDPVSEASLPRGAGADPYAPAVGRVVGAIIEYSRWPAPRPAVDLCIVGPSYHSELLTSHRLRSGRDLNVLRLAADAELSERCDAVFIGQLPLARQIGVTDALRGRAVLTIAENDPDCRSRAMVCLLFAEDALSFRLNIDSVSRSRVRIDPRVLRLGMGNSDG